MKMFGPSTSRYSPWMVIALVVGLACSKSTESKAYADAAPINIDDARIAKKVESPLKKDATSPTAPPTETLDASPQPRKVAFNNPQKTPDNARKIIEKKYDSRIAVKTKTYKITVLTPKDTKAGANGTTKIVVTPATGWKLNKAFPTKLLVKAPEGGNVAKAKQASKDALWFKPKKAVFDIGFSCVKTGKNLFAAKFKFAVCTESSCDPKKAKFHWTVNIK